MIKTEFVNILFKMLGIHILLLLFPVGCKRIVFVCVCLPDASLSFCLSVYAHVPLHMYMWSPEDDLGWPPLLLSPVFWDKSCH